MEYVRPDDAYDLKLTLCPLPIVCQKHFLRAYLLYEEACEDHNMDKVYRALAILK